MLGFTWTIPPGSREHGNSVLEGSEATVQLSTLAENGTVVSQFRKQTKSEVEDFLGKSKRGSMNELANLSKENNVFEFP